MLGSKGGYEVSEDEKSNKPLWKFCIVDMFGWCDYNMAKIVK